MAKPIKIRAVAVVNENGTYHVVGYPRGTTDQEFRGEMIDHLYGADVVDNCYKFVELTAWVMPPVSAEIPVIPVVAEDIEE